MNPLTIKIEIPVLFTDEVAVTWRFGKSISIFIKSVEPNLVKLVSFTKLFNYFTGDYVFYLRSITFAVFV